MSPINLKPRQEVQGNNLWKVQMSALPHILSQSWLRKDIWHILTKSRDTKPAWYVQKVWDILLDITVSGDGTLKFNTFRQDVIAVNHLYTSMPSLTYNNFSSRQNNVKTINYLPSSTFVQRDTGAWVCILALKDTLTLSLGLPPTSQTTLPWHSARG